MVLPKGAISPETIKALKSKEVVDGSLKMDVNFAVDLPSDDEGDAIQPKIDFEETYFNSFSITAPDVGVEIEKFVTPEFFDQFNGGDNLFFKVRDDILKEKSGAYDLLTQLNFGEKKTRDETLLCAWIAYITKGLSDPALVKFAAFLNQEGIIYRTDIAIKKTVYNFRGREVDNKSAVEGLQGRSSHAGSSWEKIESMAASGNWAPIDALLKGQREVYASMAKMFAEEAAAK